MKENLFHHKDFYEHTHFTNLHSCRQQVFSWISLPPCAFSFLFLFPAKKKRLLKPWCRAELSTHICNSQKHFNEPIIFWRERTSVKRGKVYKGLHKRYELLSQLLLQYQNDNSFQEYTQPLKINFKISLRKSLYRRCDILPQIRWSNVFREWLF